MTTFCYSSTVPLQRTSADTHLVSKAISWLAVDPVDDVTLSHCAFQGARGGLTGFNLILILIHSSGSKNFKLGPYLI